MLHEIENPKTYGPEMGPGEEQEVVELIRTIVRDGLERELPVNYVAKQSRERLGIDLYGPYRNNLNGIGTFWVSFGQLVYFSDGDVEDYDLEEANFKEEKLTNLISEDE